MEEYKTVDGSFTAEYNEKHSRFIATCFHCESESDASEIIAAQKSKYWDARHNVYAFVLQDGTARFSDDGEPHGTAGKPMLDCIQGSGITNIAVVVTRYFGGILLGAGGLVRAYTKGAKIAIDAAGKSIKRVWTVLYIPCPYTFYERVKLEAETFGAVIRKTDFAAEVELEILVAREQVQSFLDKLTDMTAGTVEGMEIGQEYRAFPVESREEAL